MDAKKQSKDNWNPWSERYKIASTKEEKLPEEKTINQNNKPQLNNIIILFILAVIFALIIFNNGSIKTEAIEQLNKPPCNQYSNDELLLTNCVMENINYERNEKNCNELKGTFFCQTNKNPSRVEEPYWCIANMAMCLQEISLCETVGEVEQECYLKVAQVNPKININDCNNSGTGYIGCFMGLAIRTKNPDLCKNYLPESKKEECYSRVAIVDTNLEKCDYSTTYCLTKTRNKICSSELDCTYTLDDCVILATDDPAGTYSSRCRYYIALRDKNKEICEFISDKQMQQDCKDLLLYT